jgi:hypothetical protein
MTLTNPTDVKKACSISLVSFYSNDGWPKASCCNLDFLKLQYSSLAALEILFSGDEIKVV